MVARDDPDALEGALPGLERVEHRLGQAEREKEAQSLIAGHAIRRGHTEFVRALCQKPPHEMERADDRAGADRGPVARES